MKPKPVPSGKKVPKKPSGSEPFENGPTGKRLPVVPPWVYGKPKGKKK